MTKKKAEKELSREVNLTAGRNVFGIRFEPDPDGGCIVELETYINDKKFSFIEKSNSERPSKKFIDQMITKYLRLTT